MWRNKRILALLLAVLCLAGCSAKQNETDFPVVPNAQTTKYELATVTEGTFCKTVKNTGNPVSRRLRFVGDNGDLLTANRIEQGRFSDIRSANDCNKGCFCHVLPLLLNFKSKRTHHRTLFFSH